MAHDEWRWVSDGMRTAEENMAIDSALLAECEQGRIPPTVRLYGWSQPAITIGYSQNAEAELDLERCRELGIALVRRPTGGRALLHTNELTYAVVAPVSLPPFNRGLKATFQAVSEALLAGLQGLGVQGDLNTNKQRSAPGVMRSPSCFASLNHCEITVDGKKLIGSAQKRTSKAFLQHGSLVIESDHALFTSVLKFKSENERAVLKERLMNSTTALNRICDRKFSFDEISAALQEGFQKTWDGVYLNI
jgi:lipoate-protein ligase A